MSEGKDLSKKKMEQHSLLNALLQMVFWIMATLLAPSPMANVTDCVAWVTNWTQQYYPEQTDFGGSSANYTYSSQQNSPQSQNFNASADADNDISAFYNSMESGSIENSPEYYTSDAGNGWQGWYPTYPETQTLPSFEIPFPADQFQYYQQDGQQWSQQQPGNCYSYSWWFVCNCVLFVDRNTRTCGVLFCVANCVLTYCPTWTSPCRTYSQINIAPVTWTFIERMIPSCGTSTQTSRCWISSTGIPSFSFLDKDD